MNKYREENETDSKAKGVGHPLVRLAREVISGGWQKGKGGGWLH